MNTYMTFIITRVTYGLEFPVRRECIYIDIYIYIYA
jgi:hypothetical protein